MNASCYRLDDSKATILQQTCCNLRVSGCVTGNHYEMFDYFSVDVFKRSLTKDHFSYRLGKLFSGFCP